REKVVARRVDGLGEIDLLVAQVAAGVLAELIGKDEQAVERRPKLVRHVGEELALVFRSERELLGLLFQGFARLFDFLVLALDFLMLVGKQSRLLLELLVVCCSSCCRLCSSFASDCDCLSRSSVRVFASIVLITMPIDSVSWSRNASWVWLNRSNDA